MINVVAEREPSGNVRLQIQDKNEPSCHTTIVISAIEWSVIQSRVGAAFDPSRSPDVEPDDPSLASLYPLGVIFEARPKGLKINFNPWGAVRFSYSVKSSNLIGFFDALREKAATILGAVKNIWDDKDIAAINNRIDDPLEDEPAVIVPDDAPTSERPVPLPPHPDGDPLL